MNSDFYEKHLKSFPTPRPLLDPEDIPFFGGLPALLRAVRKTTGVDICFIRAGGSLPGDTHSFPCFAVENSWGKTCGHLVVYGVDEGIKPLSDDEIEPLVRSLAALLGDAYRWQWALRQAEAERACDFSISCRVRKEEEVGQLLREQLKQATKILGCQAAALYLLNSDSTVLKLRVLWGLPEERLLEPPRFLRDSLADMEALLGQAVILNDEYLLETWNSPESFTTSVCVPVASDLMQYGTLWFFADCVRDFCPEELAVLEITAGRIAVEIEKTALIKEIRMLRG